MEKRLAGNPLASGGLQNNVVSDKEDAKRKGKKTKKMIRMAGGQTWEDQSLLNWDSNDYRLFAGDLGNDVTDEVIINSLFAFQQLPTLGAFPHFWTIPQLPDGEGGERQEEQQNQGLRLREL